MRSKAIMRSAISSCVVGFYLSVTTAQADYDQGQLRDVVSDAADILQDVGLDEGIDILEDPPFFDAASWLHVWAVSADWTVVFDISEQTRPGDDLSGLELLDGTDVSVAVEEAVAAGDHYLVWDGQVPHATTGQLVMSHLWCDGVGDRNIASISYICAMVWTE